jgi:hypothetical protein
MVTGRWSLFAVRSSLVVSDRSAFMLLSMIATRLSLFSPANEARMTF